MINRNVNTLNANLNRPGPILSNTIHYMVIGGGAGGDRVAFSGPGGEFITGSVDVAHLSTLTFQVGKGGIAGDGTPNTSTNGATSSLDYTPLSLSVNAAGGVAHIGVPNSGSVVGGNAKGPWDITPQYFGWAEDGGNTIGAATGFGGGVTGGTPTHSGSFPFPNSIQDADQRNAYNFSGGGGASDDSTPGDGGNGMVALALYDPRDIFETVVVDPDYDGNPPPPAPDLTAGHYFVETGGYKVWFFTHTASTGSFTLLGRRH